MIKFIDSAKKQIKIDRKDVLTIIAISLVFFSIAIWNLGMTKVPTSVWKNTNSNTFLVDLGQTVEVDQSYFLVMNGSSGINTSVGYPGNWSHIASSSFNSYYSWNEIAIGQRTRFIRFELNSSIDIVEFSILNKDQEKVPIANIYAENSTDKNLYKLIDEQDLVHFPNTYTSETYFDEIYFVRTAENHLHLEDPFEWTHPPLGKLIIASGTVIFGYNPFGWRIMGVIFATLMISVMYAFGKKMFGTWIGAFAPAFLLTFDFMHFAMGRMATADTFVVFFMLTSQLFFFIYLRDVLRKGWKVPTRPLFLSIVFFSLAFSTKWYVLYGFAAEMAILVVIRFKDVIKEKRGLVAKTRKFFSRPFLLTIIFLAIAALIYLSVFFPYFISGHSIGDIIQAQYSMYNYHSTLVATHPFSSQWWSWPLMTKPVWLYVSNLSDGFVSSIATFGNPAIWWLGIVSIILVLERTIRKSNLACLFITTFFFFQWVPYIFISRITFIYHFYVNVPLFCLATAYFIDKIWGTKWGKIIVLSYLALVFIIFLIFYPVISGTPASVLYTNSLKWLGSWIF